MALSQYEQHELAAIEDHLTVDDPHLAQLITDWPSRPPSRHRRLQLGMVITVAVTGAAMLITGCLLHDAWAPILLVAGALGLSVSAVASLRMRPAKVRPRHRTIEHKRSPWSPVGGELIGWWWL